MKNVKIIIADKNIQNIEYVLNKIVNKRNNFKTYVATTNEEILDIISNTQINAILSNKKLKITSKIQIPIFNVIEEKTENSKIDECLTEINKKEIIENEIKNDIIKQLLLLGYNFKHKGTHYLIESIIYIYKKEQMELVDNLEKNVYKYIAIRNNTTMINVKTNIIKATNYVYRYQDKEVLYKYFSINIKVTTKLVISTILNKLIL